MKEFHLKELVARTALGFFVGVFVSMYFYGAGPVGQDNLKKEEEEKG